MKILKNLMLAIPACLCLMANADEAKISQEKMPLVHMAHIELKPELREAFMVAVTENMRDSLKKELGVLALYCVADKDNPNKLTFFEMYADDGAYEIHRGTAHFKKYIETTKDMALSKELVEVAPVELRDQHNTPKEY